MVSKVALRATALTQECLGSSYKLLSVDAETADGSVKVLVVGSGELPQRNQIETRTVPLLFGNRLDVKVIYADSFTIGGRELLTDADLVPTLTPLMCTPTIGHGIDIKTL